MHVPGSRRLAIVGSLAVALASGAIGSDPSATLAAAGPTVIAGSKKGPVVIPAPKVGTVAKLSLPAGRWYVTAKALLVGATDIDALTHLGVTCRLKVGARSDAVSAAPTPKGSSPGGYGGSRVPILLSAAGQLASPGKATIRCVGETAAGDVVIGDIRMSAMRVGRLTVDVQGSGAKTSGSGSPRVISMVDKGGPPTLPGDGAYHAAGHMIVPAGHWWVVAKATALSTNFNSPDYDCRLVAGADFDELRFPLGHPGSALDTTPIGLQVVHTFPGPGVIELMCRGIQPFDMRDIVMTAVKAGTLTNRSLDSGQQTKVGSGKPRAISGYSDGPRAIQVSDTFKLVRRISLPAGRWNVLAKLWFEAAGGPHNESRVLCRLQVGARRDGTDMRYSDNLTRVGPMYLSLAYQSVEPGWLQLRCRRTHAQGTADVRFIKITALKAGALTRRTL